MVDYDTPKYPIRDAASASGFSLNTLRSNYQRGWFRIIGGERAQGEGLPHMLSLRDVLHVAVAHRLWTAGVHPEIAFKAGINFAHSGGEDDAHDGLFRVPAGVFESSKARTFLLYHPSEAKSEFPGRIIAVPHNSPETLLKELFRGNSSSTDTALILDLEDLEIRVLRLLGALVS
jgi:hypothetical protein